MRTRKLKRLQSAGWKTGSADDFLQLSDEEGMLVALRLSLADFNAPLARKRKPRPETGANAHRQRATGDPSGETERLLLRQLQQLV